MADPLDPPAPGATVDPLDPASNAQNQIWLEGLMPDLATIWRRIQIPDGLGTTTDTWYQSTSNVACRLLKAYVPTAKESVQAGAERAVMKWEALFPLGTDLKPSDSVVITQRTVIDWQAGLFEDGITQLLQVTDTDEGLSNPTTITAQLLRINRPNGLNI